MSTSTPRSPDILYHYTTPIGLKGILESSALWATDAAFLNDAQELQFGRDELCDALRRRAEALYPTMPRPDPQSDPPPDPWGPEQSRASIIQNVIHYLSLKFDFTEPMRTDPVYLTCFCEQGDLLSQWRGYGSGFALGLAPGGLLKPSLENTHSAADSPRDDLHIDLIQVHYGETTIPPVIDRILAEVAPEPRAHPGAQGGWFGAWRAIPALAGIKHEAFAEEQEWRLLALGASAERTKFRAGAYGLIPYIEQKIDLSAVREVVVGPGAHADLRALGARRLLDHLGLGVVPVRISVAPFRG
jgi:hypothetical protein